MYAAKGMGAFAANFSVMKHSYGKRNDDVATDFFERRDNDSEKRFEYKRIG